MAMYKTIFVSEDYTSSSENIVGINGEILMFGESAFSSVEQALGSGAENAIIIKVQSGKYDGFTVVTDGEANTNVTVMAVDFDGGEVMVGGENLTVADSGIAAADQATILADLNDINAGNGKVFVAASEATVDMPTIYVGMGEAGYVAGASATVITAQDTAGAAETLNTMYSTTVEAAATSGAVSISKDYTSADEGWGSTKFANWSSAYSNTTGSATITVEANSGNAGYIGDSNNSNKVGRNVIVESGSSLYVQRRLLKIDKTLTFKAGASFVDNHVPSVPTPYTHIDGGKLYVGEANSTVRATMNFKDNSVATLYSAIFEANNADISLGDFASVGKTSFTDSDITVNGSLSFGAHQSQSSLKGDSTMTNSTMTVKGHDMRDDTTYFANDFNRIAALVMDNSTITINDGADGTAAATVQLGYKGSWVKKTLTLKNNSNIIVESGTAVTALWDVTLENSTIKAGALTIQDGSFKLTGTANMDLTSLTIADGKTLTMDSSSTLTLDSLSSTGKIVVNMVEGFDGKKMFDFSNAGISSLPANIEINGGYAEIHEGDIFVYAGAKAEVDLTGETNKVDLSVNGAKLTDAVGSNDKDIEISTGDDNSKPAVTETAKLNADITGKDVKIDNSKKLEVTGFINAEGAATITNSGENIYDKDGKLVAEATFNGGYDADGNELAAKVEAEKIVMQNDGHANVDFGATNIVIANNSNETLTGIIGTADTENVLIGAGEATADGLIVDDDLDGTIENADITAKNVTIADQTVVATDFVTPQLNVFGDTTLGAGNTYTGNIFFGSKEGSVDATIDMSNVTGGNIVAGNGEVTLSGTMDSTIQGVQLDIGGFMNPGGIGPKDVEMGSTTVNVAEGAYIKPHQVYIGENEAVNDHTLNVYGKLDTSASVFTKAKGELNVYGEMNVADQKYLQAAGDVTVSGANAKLNVGGVSNYGIKIGTDEAGLRSEFTVENGASVNVGTIVNVGYSDTRNGDLIINGGNFTAASVNVQDGSTFTVAGESTLNIGTLTGNSIDLLDGAIIKNSTVGGSAFVAGNVKFRGDNTFSMISDFGNLTDYYGTTAPMQWTVEEGASLTLTDKARYGLGYGDKVVVNGTIAAGSASDARASLTDDNAENDVKQSLFMHGLVAQESKGWNENSSMTVNNAYVTIGSNNSFGNKPGNYGGTYTFNFNNTVLDSSRITFYEALSKTSMTFKDSDVKTGTFMTRDADSVFTLDNTKLESSTATNGTDEGNYNAGTLNIIGGSDLTYTAELKNEGGIINITDSSLTANGGIVNNGTFTVAGESTLNIQKFTGDGTIATGIHALDGAVLKDSTVGGYIYFDGAATLTGSNTFTGINLYGQEKTHLTVAENASLTVTDLAMRKDSQMTIYGTVTADGMTSSGGTTTYIKGGSLTTYVNENKNLNHTFDIANNGSLTLTNSYEAITVNMDTTSSLKLTGSVYDDGIALNVTGLASVAQANKILLDNNGTDKADIALTIDGVTYDLNDSISDVITIGDVVYNITNGDGNDVVIEAASKILTVNSAYTEDTPGFGFSKFNKFEDALQAASAEATAIKLESDVTVGSEIGYYNLPADLSIIADEHVTLDMAGASFYPMGKKTLVVGENVEIANMGQMIAYESRVILNGDFAGSHLWTFGWNGDAENGATGLTINETSKVKVSTQLEFRGGDVTVNGNITDTAAALGDADQIQLLGTTYGSWGGASGYATKVNLNDTYIKLAQNTIGGAATKFQDGSSAIVTMDNSIYETAAEGAFNVAATGLVNAENGSIIYINSGVRASNAGTINITDSTFESKSAFTNTGYFKIGENATATVGSIVMDGNGMLDVWGQEGNVATFNAGSITAKGENSGFYSSYGDTTVDGTIELQGSFSIGESSLKADTFKNLSQGYQQELRNVDLDVTNFVNGQNGNHAYAVISGNSKVQIDNLSGYYSLRLADGTTLKGGTNIVGSLTVRALGDVTFGETATDVVHIDSFDNNNAAGNTMTVNGTLDISSTGKGFSTYWLGVNGNADTTTLTGAGTINANTATILQYGKIVVDKDLTINVTDQYASDMRFTLTDLTIKGQVNSIGTNNKLNAIQTSDVTVTGENAALNVDSYLLVGYQTYKGNNDTVNTYKSTLNVEDGATLSVGGRTYINLESQVNVNGAVYDAGDITNYGEINLDKGTFTGKAISNSASGSIDVANGSSFTAETVDNSGALNVTSAKFTADKVSGNGTFTIGSSVDDEGKAIATELQIGNLAQDVRANENGTNPIEITGNVDGTGKFRVYGDATLNGFNYNGGYTGQVVSATGQVLTYGDTVITGNSTISVNYFQATDSVVLENGSTINAANMNLYDLAADADFVINGTVNACTFIVINDYYNTGSGSEVLVAKDGVVNGLTQNGNGRFDIQSGNMTVQGYVNGTWQSGGGTAHIGNSGLDAKLVVDGIYASADSNNGKFVNTGSQNLIIGANGTLEVVNGATFDWNTTVTNKGSITVDADSIFTAANLNTAAGSFNSTQSGEMILLNDMVISNALTAGSVVLNSGIALTVGSITVDSLNMAIGSSLTITGTGSSIANFTVTGELTGDNPYSLVLSGWNNSYASSVNYKGKNYTIVDSVENLSGINFVVIDGNLYIRDFGADTVDIYIGDDVANWTEPKIINGVIYTKGENAFASVSEITGVDEDTITTITLGDGDHLSDATAKFDNLDKILIQDADVKVVDTDIANFNGNVVIVNNGHMDVKLVANGTLDVTNTSVNTMLGSYTAEWISIDNTGRIGDVNEAVTSMTATIGDIEIANSGSAAIVENVELVTDGNVYLSGSGFGEGIAVKAASLSLYGASIALENSTVDTIYMTENKDFEFADGGELTLKAGSVIGKVNGYNGDTDKATGTVIFDGANLTDTAVQDVNKVVLASGTAHSIGKDSVFNDYREFYTEELNIASGAAFNFDHNDTSAADLHIGTTVSVDGTRVAVTGEGEMKIANDGSEAYSMDNFNVSGFEGTLNVASGSLVALEEDEDHVAAAGTVNADGTVELNGTTVADIDFAITGAGSVKVNEDKNFTGDISAYTGEYVIADDKTATYDEAATLASDMTINGEGTASFEDRTNPATVTLKSDTTTTPDIELNSNSAKLNGGAFGSINGSADLTVIADSTAQDVEIDTMTVKAGQEFNVAGDGVDTYGEVWADGDITLESGTDTDRTVLNAEYINGNNITAGDYVTVNTTNETIGQENVTFGDNAVVNASALTATNGTVTFGDNANVTATDMITAGTDITFGADADVTAAYIAADAGDITFGDDATVSADAIATYTGAISAGDGAEVSGFTSIDSATTITFGDDATLTAAVDASSVPAGDITAVSDITFGDDATLTVKDIEVTDTGDMTFGNNAEITANDVSVFKGDIEIGAGATIDINTFEALNGDITIGDNSTVNVVATTGDKWTNTLNIGAASTVNVTNDIGAETLNIGAGTTATVGGDIWTGNNAGEGIFAADNVTVSAVNISGNEIEFGNTGKVTATGDMLSFTDITFGSDADVTAASITAEKNIIFGGDAKVNVTGNITETDGGSITFGDKSEITVGGDIEATTALVADPTTGSVNFGAENTVDVTGNISAANAINVGEKSTVDVDLNVFAKEVNLGNETTATVGGDIYGVDKVLAGDNVTATVTGDIKSDVSVAFGSYADVTAADITAIDDSVTFGANADVTALGSITAGTNVTFGSDAKVNVTGSITETDGGAITFGDNSNVTVGGNIDASTAVVADPATGSVNFGANSTANVTGTVTARNAVNVGIGSELNAGNILVQGALNIGEHAKVTASGVDAANINISILVPDALGFTGPSLTLTAAVAPERLGTITVDADRSDFVSPYTVVDGVSTQTYSDLLVFVVGSESVNLNVNTAVAQEIAGYWVYGYVNNGDLQLDRMIVDNGEIFVNSDWTDSKGDRFYWGGNDIAHQHIVGNDAAKSLGYAASIVRAKDDGTASKIYIVKGDTYEVNDLTLMTAANGVSSLILSGDEVEPGTPDVAAGDALVLGNLYGTDGSSATSLTLNNIAVKGNFFGGANNAALSGDVTTVINNASTAAAMRGMVFGGSNITSDIDDSAYSSSISLIGGGYSGSMVGGGAYVDGATYSMADSTISVAAGEGGERTVISGRLFGGSVAANGATVTQESANINIDLSNGQVYLRNDVYAAGASISGGTVNVAETNVAINGDLSNLNFTGRLSGGVYGTAIGSAANTVSNLTFSDATGTFKGLIQDFDTITISGNSAVEFSRKQTLTADTGFVFDLNGKTSADAMFTVNSFGWTYGDTISINGKGMEFAADGIYTLVDTNGATVDFSGFSFTVNGTAYDITAGTIVSSGNYNYSFGIAADGDLVVDVDKLVVDANNSIADVYSDAANGATIEVAADAVADASSWGKKVTYEVADGTNFTLKNGSNANNNTSLIMGENAILTGDNNSATSFKFNGSKLVLGAGTDILAAEITGAISGNNSLELFNNATFTAEGNNDIYVNAFTNSWGKANIGAGSTFYVNNVFTNKSNTTLTGLTTGVKNNSGAVLSDFGVFVREDAANTGSGKLILDNTAMKAAKGFSVTGGSVELKNDSVLSANNGISFTGGKLNVRSGSEVVANITGGANADTIKMDVDAVLNGAVDLAGGSNVLSIENFSNLAGTKGAVALAGTVSNASIKLDGVDAVLGGAVVKIGTATADTTDDVWAKLSQQADGSLVVAWDSNEGNDLAAVLDQFDDATRSLGTAMVAASDSSTFTELSNDEFTIKKSNGHLA